MARSDTIEALRRRGISKKTATTLADAGFTIESLKTASPERVGKFISAKEAKKVLGKVGQAEAPPKKKEAKPPAAPAEPEPEEPETAEPQAPEPPPKTPDKVPKASDQESDIQKVLKDLGRALPRQVIWDLVEKTKGIKISRKQLAEVILRVCDRYDAHLIDPNESAGIVSAQSIGEPGTQMSLPYEEEVVVRERGIVRALPIGVFVDRLMTRLPVTREAATEWCDLAHDEKIEVPSLSSAGKLVWKALRSVSRHAYHDRLIRLTTSEGRTITATANHSFVRRNGGKIVPVSGRDLRLGDRIPLAKQWNSPQSLRLFESGRQLLPEASGVVFQGRAAARSEARIGVGISQGPSFGGFDPGTIPLDEGSFDSIATHSLHGPAPFGRTREIENTIGDVFWDEITEIAFVDAPTKPVYDFSVPGLETFTTARGVVTHNTMRTFHYAGVAEMNVTLGLPRLIEIVDARRVPSTPLMEIHLKPKVAKELERVKRIAQEIEMTKLDDIADIVADMVNMRVMVYPDGPKMKSRGVKSDELREKLRKFTYLEDVKRTVGGETRSTDAFVIESGEPSFKKLQRLVESVRITKVKGIDNIRRAIIRKHPPEGFVIYTEGSNLAKVLDLEEVDPTRTSTNSVEEIYETLGIEAARNAIIKEAHDTLEEQGLTVDIRHIMLVADMMTNDGDVKAIGRHGISGRKSSVLARAAFEITAHHLLRAAISGEVDALDGVAENVIVGQPVTLGTGAVNLVYKPPAGMIKKKMEPVVAAKVAE